MILILTSFHESLFMLERLSMGSPTVMMLYYTGKDVWNTSVKLRLCLDNPFHCQWNLKIFLIRRLEQISADGGNISVVQDFETYDIFIQYLNTVI